MTKSKHHALVVTLSLMPFLSASAQSWNAGADGSVPSEARCRKDVKDYLNALQFIRQAAGNQIGARVANGYLSEEQLTRTVNSLGACGAAQQLRTKGAIR